MQLPGWILARNQIHKKKHIEMGGIRGDFVLWEEDGTPCLQSAGQNVKYKVPAKAKRLQPQFNGGQESN